MTTELAPETPAAARARVVAALRNLSGGAAGFVDEFELLQSTQLFGRVTSGEIQSACRDAIAMLEADAARERALLADIEGLRSALDSMTDAALHAPPGGEEATDD